MDQHGGAEIWVAFGGLVLAIIGFIVRSERFRDKQALELRDLLADKLSIGEYVRRHDDLEKRVRSIERWQDHANGRARFYYPGIKEDEEGHEG